VIERIGDPEVRSLAGIAGLLERDYAAGQSEWAGSPFAWIKNRPSSSQRGAIGVRLVAGWLAAKGFDVAKCPDSDADRLIERRRVEVKFSTLWGNGTYLFQQFRDQDYEFVVCLGVSPFDAHCWVLPKIRVIGQWRDDGGIRSQHAGKAGKDTAWLRIDPRAPAKWLSDHGGRLADAARIIGKLTGFRPT